MKNINQRLVPIVAAFLILVLILCFTRSYNRTLNWKDNYSFIESTYETGKDSLHKATRLQMLANTLLLENPNKKDETKKYFLKTLDLLKQAKKENKINRLKYQEHLPLIIKSYGLDYNSTPIKIAYLEALTRCSSLYEHFSVGIKILKPYIKNPTKIDPMTLDLYTHLLLLDGKYKEAKDILLKANSVQHYIPVILTTLFEIAIKFENDRASAEKYLLEAFKYYPYSTNILEKALAFYEEQKNLVLKTKFAYLLGLRTQSKPAYQEAMYGYLDLGQLREAKKTMNKLLKIEPYDPETLYLASKYYFMLKDYQKALSFLQEAYKQTKKPGIEPSLAFDISNNLAKLYLFLGNKEQAISLSKENLNLADDNIESFYKLAKIYKSLGLEENLNYCIKKIQSLKKGVKSAK